MRLNTTLTVDELVPLLLLTLVPLLPLLLVLLEPFALDEGGGGTCFLTSAFYWIADAGFEHYSIHTLAFKYNVPFF